MQLLRTVCPWLKPAFVWSKSDGLRDEENGHSKQPLDCQKRSLETVWREFPAFHKRNTVLLLAGSCEGQLQLKDTARSPAAFCQRSQRNLLVLSPAYQADLPHDRNPLLGRIWLALERPTPRRMPYSYSSTKSSNPPQDLRLLLVTIKNKGPQKDLRPKGERERLSAVEHRIRCPYRELLALLLGARGGHPILASLPPAVYRFVLLPLLEGPGRQCIGCPRLTHRSLRPQIRLWGFDPAQPSRPLGLPLCGKHYARCEFCHSKTFLTTMERPHCGCPCPKKHPAGASTELLFCPRANRLVCGICAALRQNGGFSAECPIRVRAQDGQVREQALLACRVGEMADTGRRGVDGQPIFRAIRRLLIVQALRFPVNRFVVRPSPHCAVTLYGVIFSNGHWQTAAAHTAWSGVPPVVNEGIRFLAMELDGDEHTVEIEGVICATRMPRKELLRRLTAKDDA
jgi:hypothetical protein